MKAFKPSPDRKMIKLLTFGNLFPATTLGTVSKDHDDDNNNVKKQLVLWAKESSRRTSRSLVHFFHVHYTTMTWNLPMRCFIQDVDKFSLLYLNMDLKALKNSTPGKIALIWQIQRFQIDAIKFKRTQINFYWCFHCRRRLRCLTSLFSLKPVVEWPRHHFTWRLFTRARYLEWNKSRPRL